MHLSYLYQYSLRENKPLYCILHETFILIGSSDSAVAVCQLNEYTSRGQVIDQCVKSATYLKGTTNTAEGLRYLYTTMFTSANGDRADAPNVAVIFTDGESNNPMSTMQVLC